MGLGGAKKKKVVLDKGEQNRSIPIYNTIFVNLPGIISPPNKAAIQNDPILNFAKTAKNVR
ncbi:hypothetical protein A3860_35670 [Niastella vici]|uniref:Uncharacterized protein n=1 Tax=Niastella vici TaxID=1703345 RepID=A0A1V9FNT3_9BACT|nr:hypothetical protein A3860_35670 [Niastella vici]